MRNLTHRFVTLTFVASCFLISGNSLQAQPESSVQPSSAKPKPAEKITIDDFAWIAGNWKGEAMGGQFEETWNAPMADSMVGMFKMVSDNKVNFYEILTIVPKDDTYVLRLKHFGADLVGWEEKDKSVEFPLVKVTQNEAEFNGLTFRKISADEMHILVTMKSKDKTSVVNFKCHRASKTGDKAKSKGRDQ